MFTKTPLTRPTGTLSHIGAREKIAFTLAEVLITLGIIGVVAALTLPTLIQHHRKTVVETRLAKFYSTINQAIQRAEVDYGDKASWKLTDTDTFWETYLKPYIQYSKTEDIQYEYYKTKVVYMPDGSLFTTDIFVDKKEETGDMIEYNGGHFIFFPEAKNFKVAMIDSKTGQFGSKCFRFAFWPASSYAPTAFKYHKNKGVEPYMANWNGDIETLKTSSTYGCNKDGGNGSYCTAIIKQNGWKIPDDYPLSF